jgi:hypothetical protein
MSSGESKNGDVAQESLGSFLMLGGSAKGKSISESPERVDESTSREMTGSNELPQRHRSETGATSAASSQTDDVPSSRSSNPDKHRGDPTSHTDRVFPIRSVVSVDSTQTPYTPPGRRASDANGYFASVPGRDSAGSSRAQVQVTSDSKPMPRIQRRQERSPHSEEGKDRSLSSRRLRNEHNEFGGRPALQLFSSDNRSDKSNELSGVFLLNSSFRKRDTPSDQGSMTDHITVKYKHVVTDEGHAVITGRDGDVIQRCEDEPIHIPGAIQGFGLIIALEEQEDGNLLVRVVSENSYRMIGYTPQELFGLKSFCDILSEEHQDNLLDHIDFIRDEETDPAANGPEVFTISIVSPRQNKKLKMWCAMHVNPNHPDLIICEFEFSNDEEYPLSPSCDGELQPPEDTLNSEPTEEELAESTQNISKPLRVLRSARKQKGEAATMEAFNVMSQIQEQLASAPDLESFLKILVGVVRELTGFHRVMIYQFDNNFNGRVVTELVDVSFKLCLREVKKEMAKIGKFRSSPT